MAILDSRDILEFPEVVQKLCLECLKAREKGYAPYSNFTVGAAILCENGEVFSGCNVENVAYGHSICAERTAAVKAVSDGNTEFVMVAVSGEVKGENKFVTPCGACRQVLCEFNPKIPIYLVRPDLQVHSTTLEILLPSSFSPKDHLRLKYNAKLD